MSREISRCAIYTRKSNEEGLDQPFNSLDAQRESGIDYIRSQKHQGWQVVEKCYDDGGYSGGTMRRPALKQLLNDIERGEVDVVVVYKVDRLSRSLGDFARLMELFDKHDVSFVSVTQQFSTTTSMGRLTLNMLLSFAQFEREVTGERIRDKIAATKKKGMWVGGQPPLGYRLENRRLVVIRKEAELMRRVFEGYLDRPSVVELADRFNRDGCATKRWRSSTGRWHGGRRLTPKYLYRILTNPLYIGKIVHKDRTWQGQHEAIIHRSLWDRVHRLIEKQERRSQHRWTHPNLLKGKLRTQEGYAMSPGSVQRPGKAKGAKRLVRYYVSQKAIKQGYRHCPIKTINTGHVDDLVRALVLDYLRDESVNHLDRQEAQVRDHWIRTMVAEVRLAPDELVMRLDLAKITACREHEWPRVNGEHQPGPFPTCLYRPSVERRQRYVILTLPLEIKRLDGKRMLLSPDGHDLVIPSQRQPKDHIVKAIGLAYRWHRTLTKAGRTIKGVAKEHGVSEGRVRRLLPLTRLSPRVLKLALTGELAPSITLKDLFATAEHLDWSKQVNALGLRDQPDQTRIPVVPIAPPPLPPG